MSTDIVATLRAWPGEPTEDALASHVVARIMADAADEVERLRADLQAERWQTDVLFNQIALQNDLIRDKWKERTHGDQDRTD